jgi:hypothetical protein
MRNIFATLKKDIALLIVIVLLCISIAGAILEGTSSLSGIGLIYLSVTILGIILTRRWNSVKNYLILTAASILCFFISVLLYNIIHGIFQHWFGADFWEKIITRDEFLFFGIAVFICPIGFIIGTVGSITLAIKRLANRGKTADAVVPDEVPPSS